MTDTIPNPYRGYRFSRCTPLAENQRDQLIAAFRIPSGPSAKALGGRRQMATVFLEGIGAVVVKCYRRGGLISRFNTRYFLMGRKTRSEREYEWLDRVRMLGVNAPEPIAAAHQGLLAYRCWLVTREIAGATPLAHLGGKRSEKLDALGAACNRQVDILVANRIRHPDLHPGNVLVDPGGQTWLIDFDKTGYYRGRRSHLAAYYRRRWRRAVRKHGLTAQVAAIMKPARNDRPE